MEGIYSVVIWSESDDRGTATEIWSGSNLKKAILYAAVEYTKKEMLEYYCRTTVIKNIDPELEAMGYLPSIVKSFGDEEIPIFQRVHVFLL